MSNQTKVDGNGSKKLRRKRGIKYLIASLPFVVFVFLFSYVPLFGWYLAFADYEVGMRFWDAEFVGFKNFERFLVDRQILRVLRNTLVMSGLGLLTSPLPIAFAIMLNEIRSSKLKKAAQTITTLPHFISWIVVFGVSFVIFSGNGMWNDLMKMLGLPTKPAGLIGDSELVWWFQLFLAKWKGLGWGSIVYLAAIAGIDSELYDAGKVDGANKLQLVRHITIPGVMPTYLVLLLLDVGSILSNGFDQYFTFWNSLTSDKIEVLDYYVYHVAFRMYQYPYSIAIGMIKCIISIFMLGIVNWLAKKIRGYSLI